MYIFIVLLLVICRDVRVHGHERQQTRHALLLNITKSVSEILHTLKEENNGPPKNLAYEKETFQSSTHPSGNSYKAVDGISNPMWNGGSCACTNPETHPYWYVDLGKEHSIKRIRITNRGDCCPERLHDVKATVAGHDKKFNIPCGFFKGPGIVSQKVVLQCPQGTKGRYVRLQITRGSGNFLTLCEVEVFGK